MVHWEPSAPTDDNEAWCRMPAATYTYKGYQGTASAGLSGVGRTRPPGRAGRTHLLPRIHNAADEEDRIGTSVTDQKKERVIGAENDRLFWLTRRSEADANTRRGCRFRSLLGNIDKRFVDYLGNRQAALRADPRKI